MDECAKSAVGIISTLRSGGQPGHPPGDVDITHHPHSAATVIALISTPAKLDICRELNLQCMLKGVVTDGLRFCDPNNNMPWLQYQNRHYAGGEISIAARAQDTERFASYLWDKMMPSYEPNQ
jgi:hypothetical protein